MTSRHSGIAPGRQFCTPIFFHAQAFPFVLLCVRFVVSLFPGICAVLDEVSSIDEAHEPLFSNAWVSLFGLLRFGFRL